MVMVAGWWADVSLPTVTIFHAHHAKPIGAFGLVAGGFTIAYQPADLSLTVDLRPLPSPPPPGRGLGIDSSCE